MKVKHPLLFVSVCFAFGGIGTVAVICGFIGFGLYSVVGKYAVYVALFLQCLCLCINHCSFKRYKHVKHRHTPSVKMRRFFHVSLAIWALGTLVLLGTLLWILCGGYISVRWNRALCVTGCILSPIGWLGLLLASHRKRQALLVLNPESPLSESS
ncbi:MAG: hypothetical protein IKT58_03015 [Oscillospiraceae bacterium]|nr:hypothetical protein [Oscillospiraceae bacterium]